MAPTIAYTKTSGRKIRTVQSKDTDYTITLDTYVKKSTAIDVTGAESLTLSVKSSVSSLISILDADATTYLATDVALYTSSGTQLVTKTLDLKAMAIKKIIIKVDGQNAAPTCPFMLTVNYRE